MMALSGIDRVSEGLGRINGRFTYSLKNIPMSTPRQYKVKYLSAVNSFLQRIRWTAYFYKKKLESNCGITIINNQESASVSRSVFKSKKSAPICSYLKGFEHDLIEICNSLKFRKVSNSLQRKMNDDISYINKSNEIIVFADKTNNLYSVNPNYYEKLLKENITKSYKIADDNVINNINDSTQELITKNKIQGKIEKLDKSEAFITIKDHKENFPADIKCRLINPSKAYIARYSKFLLDKIVTEVRSHAGLVQWKNTFEVLSWFKDIKDKKNKCFVSFDIVDFYPSITKEHLIKSFEFASNYIEIPECDKEIIMKACETVLISDSKVWCKKDNNGLFDVPQGSFHGAEICNLVGLFVLYKLRSGINFDSIGLYRDDGLAIINKSNGQSYENLRKKIHKNMKDIGFRIVLSIGNTVENFLDCTLELNSGIHKPYRKPNSRVQYIDKQSNHPNHILKELPNMVEKRLSGLSSSVSVFSNVVDEYNIALNKCGFVGGLKFSSNEQKKRRKSNRKIIYFNPPFCSSVMTKVGRLFLELIDKHFPKNHIYNKIFNRNTVKLSYSCMINMRGIIQAHNKKVWNKYKKGNNKRVKIEKECNCRKKTECPLNGKCKQKGVVYQADVVSELGNKIYIGSTGREFKERYYGHTRSFKSRNSMITELSKYYWRTLDITKKKPTIKWKVLYRLNTGGRGRNCRICEMERLAMMEADEKNLLNRRSEFGASCVHRRSDFFK